MGWSDSHLHEYEIANRRYGIEDPDWPSSVPIFDERHARLKSFVEDKVRDFTSFSRPDRSERHRLACLRLSKGGQSRVDGLNDD